MRAVWMALVGARATDNQSTSLGDGQTYEVSQTLASEVSANVWFLDQRGSDSSEGKSFEQVRACPVSKHTGHVFVCLEIFFFFFQLIRVSFLLQNDMECTETSFVPS